MALTSQALSSLSGVTGFSPNPQLQPSRNSIDARVQAAASQSLGREERALAAARPSTILGSAHTISVLGDQADMGPADEAFAAMGVPRTTSEMTIADTGACVVESTAALFTMSAAKAEMQEAFALGSKTGVVAAAGYLYENASRFVTGSSRTAANLLQATSLTGAGQAAGVLGSLATGGLSSVVIGGLIANSVSCAQKHSMTSIFKETPGSTPEQNALNAFNKMKEAKETTPEDRVRVFRNILENKEPWYKKSTVSLLVEEHFKNIPKAKERLKKILEDPILLDNSQNRDLAEAINNLPVPQDTEYQSTVNDFKDKPPLALNTVMTLSEQKPWVNNYIKLAQLLHKMGVENETLNKRQAFTSAFGENVSKKVDELVSNNGSDQAKIELVKTAKKTLKSSLAKSWVKIAGYLSFTIGLAMAYMFTGGTFVLIELALSLAASAALLGVKIHHLYKVYKSDKLTSQQKRLIASSSIACMALAIFSIVASKCLGGGLVLNVALIASWVCTGIYSIYVWKKMKNTPVEPAEESQPPIADPAPVDANSF
jgi:hypothetical protein